ncbi:MAG TPA: hypothetical protein VFW71_16520 [Actinomycetota bacterium]|nr:hypothetical protein [Actinomycetota bacterium]
MVVDVPTWSLDRPLTYRVPPALVGAAVLGAVVRVPLHGRRVRGWVVGPADPAATPAPGDLQDVAGVSGSGLVFDAALLSAARALARRSVHPLSTFLRLLTPPQMGRRMTRAAPDGPLGGPLAVTRRPLASQRKVLRRLGPTEDPVAVYEPAIRSVVESGRGVLVVLPVVRTGARVVEGLTEALGDQAAVVHSDQSDAARSRALWAAARGRCPVILGGRGSVFAPAFDLGLIIVHAEDDWTLKAESAPYFDARDVAELRAGASGAELWLASVTPSVRSWHRASRGRWERVQPAVDRWPAVVCAPPLGRVMSEPAVAAILAARAAGTRVLIHVPRVQGTAAGPGPAEVAKYVARVAPNARIGIAQADGSPPEALDADIVVATPGGLREVQQPVGAVVVLGVDARLRWPSGSTVEEAFGVLWRLGAVAAQSDLPGRMVLETEQPHHHAVRAVIDGDYDLFLRQERAARRATASPPFVTLARVRGAALGDATVSQLGALPGTEVFGPMGGRQGPEVLLKIEDPEAVLDELRGVVAASSKGRGAERLVVEMEPRDW